MRSLAGISIGKAGLLSGPVDLCGICLRRIRPGVSRTSTAAAGLFSASLRQPRRIHFGAGRCSWYPQNNATAATLASDKYFTNRILEDAGVATLGGEYFFLHDRHRAHRPAGHERDDAFDYFRKLGAAAFVKPLAGIARRFRASRSRRSRARSISAGGFTALRCDTDPAGRLRDRIPDLSARRRGGLCGAKISARFCWAMASRSIRDLLIAHNAALQARGLSPASPQHADDVARHRAAPKASAGKFPGG